MTNTVQWVKVTWILEAKVVAPPILDNLEKEDLDLEQKSIKLPSCPNCQQISVLMLHVSVTLNQSCMHHICWSALWVLKYCKMITLS